MKRVYLDYNATTPVKEAVKQEIVKDLELFGNASSMHNSGREARARVEQARRSVAGLLGGRPENIIFTSGGSESNNTVFNTFLNIVREKKGSGGRDEFITTVIEHPCVLNSAKHIESLGFKVHFLPVDREGKVMMDALKSVLSGKTLLVSVMFANNEIGTIQDIKEITRLTKEAGAFMHTDATQAAGKIPVDVEALGVDYLTMSGHKIYGPKGIGALYVRGKAPLDPLIHGGHQEDGLRAGTYNNIGILGLGKAAELAKDDIAVYGSTVRALRNKLRDGLLAKVPETNVNGPLKDEDVLPNTLDMSFPGAEGESILLALDLKGIEVSTGSACASGSLEPSHVITAIGVSAEAAHGSIRFSLGLGTTQEDIDYVLETLPPVIARLRAMSTAV